MRGEDARLHARVIQDADAEQQVRTFLQRVNECIGLLHVELQLRIAAAQLGQPGRQMPLAEDHRCIDPYETAGFTVLLLQGPLGFLQLREYQAGMMFEQSPRLGRRNGARMAIQQLLLQRVFHHLDLPRNRGGRHTFTARNFGKTPSIKHGDEQAQRLESQLVEAVHD